MGVVGVGGVEFGGGDGWGSLGEWGGGGNCTPNHRTLGTSRPWVVARVSE